MTSERRHARLALRESEPSSSSRACGDEDARLELPQDVAPGAKASFDYGLDHRTRLMSSVDSSSGVARARQIALEERGELNPKLWIALRLLALLQPYTLVRTRMRVLRLAGVQIGPRTVVCGRLSIAGSRDAHRRVMIGADCMINDGCRLDTGAPITIEDDVYFCHDVTVLTGTHDIGPHDRRCHGWRAEPVTIGRGSWLGARALVLPGVTIGAGCVVAAGAVVTESVAPDTLVGGVPARVLRTLGD
jgi:maltose O-acetyltransferase